MAPIESRNVIDNRIAMSTRQAAAATPTTPTPLSSGVIIGIAVAGATILIFISAVMLYLIMRKRKQHRLAMSELGERVLPISTVRHMEQAPRPVSGIRCGKLVPLPQSQAGWDALGSSDTINEPAKRKRDSVSLPRRIKSAQGIHLRRLKHLSAIAESPRSVSRKASAAPSFHTMGSVAEMVGSRGEDTTGRARTTEELLTQRCDQDTQAGSPKLSVLPSFAINSPARYGAAIANDECRPPAMRSVSTGVLDADGAMFGISDLYNRTSRRIRPEMHTRSISLGAPLTKPPSRPVPPLPVASPSNLTNKISSRQGVCVSRLSSSSSINSAGSSVLVTSPILNRFDEKQPLSSPTVEEIVADKDHAELKTVANRQWHSPQIAGPKADSGVNVMRVEKARGSVRGNIVRYSSDSMLSRQLSSASTAPSDTDSKNRLSIPQIGTADRIRISRVSLTNSLASSPILKIETPSRAHSQRRSHVTASGSPRERKKKHSSVLRDISGNAHKTSPQRQVSISTEDSNRSSNGNPFQWDCGSSNSLPKPSAMKGSPNARKGHKRQNCVRISTLTPQILGPRSRSISPAGIMMAEIVEERESDELRRGSSDRQEIERVVARERRSSRPPMSNRTTSSESNLRVQTLRASLTPGSPTLAMWTAFREGLALPSHPSDASMSAMSASPGHRSESRASVNSAFVIPRFPSPSKARASVALSQLDTAPMPQFSLDMESPTLGLDDRDRKASSPFVLDMSSEEPTPLSPVSPIDTPSSPPIHVSKTEAYDPAWPMVTFPAPDDEYDPASPPIVWNTENGEDQGSSSYFLPFAISDLDADEISPKSRPTSYTSPAIDDDRPISPKTVPGQLRPQSHAAGPKKLTSENASSVMARIRGGSLSTSNFLSAKIPVLSPPDSGYEDLPLPQWQPQQAAPAANPRHTRQRSVSNVNFRPPRVGPPAPDLPTIPQSDDSPPSVGPSPFHIPVSSVKTNAGKQCPRGPRSAPAKSVLKNAMALRRMNSEARCDQAAESRNYVRLGREASPLLPWIGILDNNDGESCSDLFNFGFDARAGADENQDRTPSRRVNVKNASAMDEIDFEAISKNIDGALTGFNVDYNAWSSPYSERTSSEQLRGSTVWDDGEKFWDNRSPVVQPIQPPKLRYAHTLEQTPSRHMEEQTVDPRLLSTPVSILRHGSSPGGGAGSIQVTPKSLYDADGFLRT